MFMFDTAVVF